MRHFMGDSGPWSGDAEPGAVNLGQGGAWGEELLLAVVECLPVCAENRLFVSAGDKLAREVNGVF